MKKMKKRMLAALAVGTAVSAVLPSVASADTLEAAQHGVFPDSAAINSIWVIVAGCLVMFMQAGFAFLEIGFSRAKNAGTVVAKILANFSIATIGWYACGFAFAFGTGQIIGHDGFLLQDFGNPLKAFPVMGLSDATVESKWFFQLVFCAVSLAIVWGTTLERIKFGVYVIYALVFSTLIYPIGAHWVFGGGWLQANVGMQDFAGSTAVHLIGATGGLAVLLLLGARKGKYSSEGKPRPIPGHSMPLFGLGILILWLCWFGLNPGSTLGALDGRFPEVLMITQLAAAAGVITAAIPIGAVAGVIVVVGVLAIDRVIDDPVGALSAHGLAGIWGTLSCGFFTSPRLAEYNGFGNPDGGLLYSGSFAQLGHQALGVVVAFSFVFAASFATFWIIKKVYGLRVTEEQEDAGLDISEHGMYGYPEQFIPPEEYPGGVAAPVRPTVPAPATAMMSDQPSKA